MKNLIPEQSRIPQLEHEGSALALLISATHPRACAGMGMNESLDPVTCTLSELRDEIYKLASASPAPAQYRIRAAYLMGVEHARVIIAAATGGKIQ